MIPADGPQETESKAEERLYYRLKRTLGDDFTVIHSLPWLAACAREINNDAAPTGEIDFLVIHADLGVLALEVKGGEYKVERLRFVHKTKNFSVNPVAQIRRNIHGLATWLGVDPSLRWRIHYGLIFPDSDFGDAAVSAALVDVTVHPPKKILIDRCELPLIGDRIREIMLYWRTTLQQPPFGVDRKQKIIDAICPEFDGTPQWGSRAIFDQREWLQLTAEQATVVSHLSKQSNAVVTGMPGSGKTVIAIELVNQQTALGKRVLFLTVNKLLSEHIQSQFENAAQVSVFNWHRFCSKYSGSKWHGVDRSSEWMEAGCLRDFEDAANQGRVDNFDLIVLDEAQAFRHDWIAALCKWHQTGITAFCDSSQVFSFERDRISLDALCQQLNVKHPYTLTISLRTPKAIFDRILGVRPPNYQAFSPRTLVADSLQEKLVTNMEQALSATLADLAKAGIAPSDIVVLTKIGWVNGGQQADAFYEIVSRVRGLEAPAIVIFDAHEMDEQELLCAYSRATTICVALFDAEALGAKPPEGSFQRTLLESPIHAGKAQKAFQAAQTLSIVQKELAPNWLGFKSVEIGWSGNWGGWLIPRGCFSVVSSLWIDYLLSHYRWPIFVWSQDAIRSVECYRPSSDDNDEREYLGRFDVVPCIECGTVSPQKREVGGGRFCLICRTKEERLGSFNSAPSEHSLEVLRSLDAVIALPHGERPKDQLKRLPLSLGVAALAIHADKNPLQRFSIDLDLSSGTRMYKAALVIVNAYIKRLPSGKEFDAQAVAQLTYARVAVPADLSVKQWKVFTDQALNKHFKRKIIEKGELPGLWFIPNVEETTPDPS